MPASLLVQTCLFIKAHHRSVNLGVDPVFRMPRLCTKSGVDNVMSDTAEAEVAALN